MSSREHAALRKNRERPTVGRAVVGTVDHSVTAVVAAYQAEEFISAALESILGQTRPPDEVIVVDDGSTDGTAAELARFAGRIRVIRQPNRGCPAAFNTAFREARGDFVAMCGADDLWDPQKLQWQMEAIRAHPQADVFFGHALVVGLIQCEHVRPPGTGLLESSKFREALFRQNCVCAPSIVIRRSLFERLGPFVEDFGADDYEYWFRCLRAGAKFYYDPRPLMRWRQHGGNLSRQMRWMDECACEVRMRYRDDVADRALVRRSLASSFFKIGRALVDENRPREARSAFCQSLRFARGARPSANFRSLLWAMLLGLPTSPREHLGQGLVRTSRTIEHLRGRRHPALP